MAHPTLEPMPGACGYYYSCKPSKRRKAKIDETKHVQPLTMASDLHGAVSELLNKVDGFSSSSCIDPASSSCCDAAKTSLRHALAVWLHELESLICELLDAYSSRIERARSSSVNDSQNAVAGGVLLISLGNIVVIILSPTNVCASSSTDPDCMQSISGSSLVPPAMLQFAKTRKLSIERSDCRKSVIVSILSNC
ncbi:hypothetical protein Cgig2_023529 [Carnegiea gigantea]|uniref:Uncharacterized protein n=1 Tax=Carnegiea gigantea TaxID=171969 RepID=A0A9Q1GXN1_9CARY|nr:hypothetical protein Cgig2_023529 [Carnegiea gigantea]